jgi:ribosomal-protein-alanine N-acetyltransferase
MALVRSSDKVVIETERLVLRTARHGDEPALAAFYSENRDHLKPFSPTFDEELFSVKGWRERIDATLAEYRSGRGLRLLLFPIGEPHRAIGVANFTSITSFPSFMCNLGYSIAADQEAKGLMTEGLRAAISYVFTELGLHRIEANYMPRNDRSARVLAKLGFVIEGHAKEYLLIDGKWEDHVRTSLTNPAWQ